MDNEFNSENNRTADGRLIKKKVVCDCGQDILIDREAVGYYCPVCAVTKMIGAGLGLELPGD